MPKATRLPSSSPAPSTDAFSPEAGPWSSNNSNIADDDAQMDMDDMEDSTQESTPAHTPAPPTPAAAALPMAAHPYPPPWAWYPHQPPPQHAAYSHIHHHPLTLAPSALTFTPPQPSQPPTASAASQPAKPKATAKKAAKRAPSPTPSDPDDDYEKPKPQAKKVRGARISSSEFVPPDVSGLSKREARLVKNRAAAFLSRQRKREEFECMEVRVTALEKENARLKALANSSTPTPSAILASTSSAASPEAELKALRDQLAASAARERELLAEMQRLRVGGAPKSDSGDDIPELPLPVKEEDVDSTVEEIETPSVGMPMAAGRSHGHHGHSHDKEKSVPGLGFMVLLFSLSLLTSSSSSASLLGARRAAQGLPTQFAFSPVPPIASAASGTGNFLMDSMLSRFTEKDEEERRKAAAAKRTGAAVPDETNNEAMDFDYTPSSEQLPAEFEIDFDIPDASNLALLSHSAASPAPSDSSSSSSSAASNASTTTQKIRVRIQPAASSSSTATPITAPAPLASPEPLAWDGSRLPSLPFSDELILAPPATAPNPPTIPTSDLDLTSFANTFDKDAAGFNFDFTSPLSTTGAEAIASMAAATNADLDLSAFTTFDFDEEPTKDGTAASAPTLGSLGMYGVGLPSSFHPTVIPTSPTTVSKADLAGATDWLLPPANARRSRPSGAGSDRPRKRLRIAAKEGGEWEVEVLE